MKTMPRFLFLLFCLSIMTMLLIAKFGLYMDSQFYPDGRVEFSSRQPIKAEDLSVVNLDSKHQMEVEELQQKIRNLESALIATDTKAKNLTSQISHQSLIIRSLQEYKNNSDLQNTAASELKYSSYMENKVKNAEILHGVTLNSEYELIPFTKFTLNKIFLVEPGLGRRVVEKPIGYRRKDLVEVVLYGLDELNKASSTDKKYTIEDFIEGMYRTDPTTGTHYELFFRNLAKPLKHVYTKITVMRPFGHLHVADTHLKNTTSTWINLILPLSGRVEAFKQFMSRFIRVCISQDKRVFLTVVYFGKEGLTEVKELMMTTAKQYKYRHMKLVTLKEKFSRGRGLQVGVLSWKSVDVLLFLCDVDVVFTADYLERCRVNTEKGKRVYYPIVFSLYNPNIVYSLQDMKIPSEREQLIISRNTGFWRDFGYGMTCQYLSDFKSIKGFDEYISGWGGEDVFLYQKYIRSQYLVVRSTDPGIFHLWHEKLCDPNLSSDQYRSCIRSKALSEASHAQLGLLAFQEEVNIHKNIARKQKAADDKMMIPEMGSLHIPNMEETMNPEEVANGNFRR